MRLLLIGLLCLLPAAGSGTAAETNWPDAFERGGTRPNPIAEGAFHFTDRDRFLAETGATLASADLPDKSSPPEPFVSGSIEFKALAPSSLNFADWGVDFPGDNDIEIALNGNENLDVRSIEPPITRGITPQPSRPVHALGIEFADPGGAPSEFLVRALTASGEEVALIAFDAPQSAPGFIGIWSPVPFSRLQIREAPSANENEFFGRVYTGDAPPPIRWRKLKQEGGNKSGEFGRALAVDDGFAVVGAPGIEMAFILERQDDTWSESSQLAPSDRNRAFGRSVAIHGDLAVVGAPEATVDASSDAGAVHVFQRQPGTPSDWTPAGIVVASDATAGAFFGSRVAVDGERLLVTDRRNPPRAYVFERSGLGIWFELHSFATAPVSDPVDIDLDGDLALVGPQLFRREETFPRGGGIEEWVLEQTLTAPATVPDGLGVAAVLHGERVLIGAPFFDALRGVAYLFERRAPGDWQRVATFSVADAGEQFGRSVALDGEDIVIGAPAADINGPDSGAIYRFVVAAGGWVQVSKSAPPDNVADDRLGSEGGLDIDARTVFIGAAEDSDYFERSGTVYLFDFLLFADGFEEPSSP
ncbi:hypothetical protein HFP89_06130 [Wenzhouxiangella sp. XN79A]|uniref:hypothetical protein n=1 Tax=Wenzhouxiangella sp. XN79A TaxID=2724193 RepID=UPI00144A90E4|nr:hypothetical protein [Wenzhouxiangella sp. XN79A]NKI34739.1 hypothetical protein [Wenzhouxiangella sp. XN79A]